MLLRMLPGLSNNSRCTDDEQPPEIAISLLGDAAEPLLASRFTISDAALLAHSLN
jgi:hypothetical protein